MTLLLEEVRVHDREPGLFLKIVLAEAMSRPQKKEPPIRRLLSTTHTSPYRELFASGDGWTVHDEPLSWFARP